MVKHIVLFKLKNQADRPKALEALNSMKGKIEGLIDLETGEDFLASERSYDIALICTLKDRDALDFYQAHSVHQPVKKIMHAIRESSIAVDYEY
ncbi:MAG: Dabb family protein [Firmicutes bacterium]|nr:Dabb family protein [Bacillota bacterium]